MISLRTFNASRAVKAVGVLLLGAMAAFVIRLLVRTLDGRGLESYRTQWGIDTTPVQALMGIAVTTLVLGIAELFAWRRLGFRSLAGPRPRRARGRIRPRARESGRFFMVLIVGSGLLAGPPASAQVAAREETPRLPAPGMKLRLESITPSDGALIGPYTVLRASLSYAIADFEPNTFRIITQFDTDTQEEGMTSGDHAGDCKLVKPSGRCEVRFPILAVWNEPGVSRPFKVWFYLTRRNERRSSTVVALAGPVRYRAK